MKKNRFKKIMSARQRKLEIINYRAEKLSRKAIQKERKKSLDVKSHYLKLESELEDKYKTIFDSISQLESKARSRSNRITKNTINKCRQLLDSAREFYLGAKSIQSESTAATEKILAAKKDLDSKFIELTKPVGIIGDNIIRTDKELKKIDILSANLDNMQRDIKNNVVQ